MERRGRGRERKEGGLNALIVLSEVEGEGLRSTFAVDTDERGSRLEHELLVGDDDAPARKRGGRSGEYHSS